MVTESSSTHEMLKDFMKPTEVKDVPTEAVVIEPEPAPDPEPPATEPPKEKATPSLSADTMAEIYLSVVDGTQTLIFSSINKKKMARRFGDKLAEAEKLLNELERGALQPQDLSPDQYGLFMRIKNLSEVRDAIPFSDEEYEKMKVPLTKIIEDSGHDLPPSMALVLVGLEVMAPRIVDAMFE